MYAHEIFNGDVIIEPLFIFLVLISANTAIGEGAHFKYLYFVLKKKNMFAIAFL